MEHQFFDLSKLANSEEGCIIGAVSIFNPEALQKEFLKQIRGKNISLEKGFENYIIEILHRKLLTEYKIYGDPSISINFKSGPRDIWLNITEARMEVEAILFPEIPELKIDKLKTFVIEENSPEAYQSYIETLKEAVKVWKNSEEPISMGDKVLLECSVEDSTHAHEILVNDSLHESLKNSVLGKKTGDNFKYDFEMSALNNYFSKNPQYKEYRKLFKKEQQKNIESLMTIKEVKKQQKAENEDELIAAFGLESKKESLPEIIKVNISSELAGLNLNYHREQIIAHIIASELLLPTKLINFYEASTIAKIGQDKDPEAIKKIDPTAESYEDLLQKCNKGISERLKLHFFAESLREKMGISEQQIRPYIQSYFSSMGNNSPNQRQYNLAREVVILNSYASRYLHSVELEKIEVKNIPEAYKIFTEECGKTDKAYQIYSQLINF